MIIASCEVLIKAMKEGVDSWLLLMLCDGLCYVMAYANNKFEINFYYIFKWELINLSW